MSKYECMNCHSIHNLDEYKDTECDGDVFGKCPTCNKTSVKTHYMKQYVKLKKC